MRKNARRATLVLRILAQDMNRRSTVTFDTQLLDGSIPCINLLSSISLKYEIKEPQLVPHPCLCGNASYDAVFNHTKQNVLLDIQTSPLCCCDKQNAQLPKTFQKIKAHWHTLCVRGTALSHWFMSLLPSTCHDSICFLRSNSVNNFRKDKWKVISKLE